MSGEVAVGGKSILSRRCWNHSLREAVARCPSCTQFYCRECVVEHEGKMSCQSCLSGEVESESKGAGAGAKLISAGLTLLSVAALWVFFYMVGSWLRALPEEYHENPAEYLDWVEEDE